MSLKCLLKQDEMDGIWLPWLARKIVEDKADVMTRLCKTFENIDSEWKYGNVYRRCYDEGENFSSIQQWHS